MKLALKFAGGIVLALAVAAAAAAAFVYFHAATPDHPVGFEEVTVKDPADKPLDVGIWYPSRSASHVALLGLSAQRLATDGAVAGDHLPLVVISHGNGGLFSSHADTALALASAGFIVAAVTHTGDNAQDQSYVGTARWLIDRPRHIRLLIDYMLHVWHAHARIDRARVGMFGFSAGGFTALVSIGGVPDFSRLSEHCRAHPEFACTLWKTLPAPVPASVWIRDPRVAAAVIAAPGYSFAFAPNGLSGITAAVQLWNGSEDGKVPYASNEAVVRALLPSAPDYHAVPGAGHFAFVSPCPSWLLPLICKDPGNFDRVRFHRDFNRAVIAFFKGNLQPEAVAKP